MSTTNGTLYIVATPIGNMQDITLRALDTLKTVNGVVAEDTRRAGLLISKLAIDPKPKFHSLHAQSKPEKLEKIIKLLQNGESLAYITDAGTPGISDPGFKLTEAAWDAGIQVVPIPGASAFVTALSAAGIPTRSILFLGFLPKKKGRQTLLKTLPDSDHTLVFYESTYRILKTLEELGSYFSKHEIVVAKELTKMHEHYFFGTPKKIADQLQSTPGLTKGEWVIMIPPK